VRLPTYPFQRERYWMEEARPQARRLGGSGHPLLGVHLESSLQPGAHFWEMDLGVDSTGFLTDHRVQGLAVLPGAAYVEMALAAATEAFGKTPAVEQVHFKKVLILPEEGARTVQVVITSEAQESASFQISSRAANGPLTENAWTLHATGVLRLGGEQSAGASPALEEIRARCGETVTGVAHYQALEARELQYGPTFQGVEQLWRRDGESLAKLLIPDALVPELGRYQVHPALLDLCFQALGAALPSQRLAEDRGTYLPVQLGHLRVLRPPRTARWAHALQKPGTEGQSGTFEGDLRLLDDQGQCVVEVLGLRAQRIDTAIQDGLGDMLHRLKWQPVARPNPLPETRPAAGRWLLLAGASGVGAALAERLGTAGEAPIIVAPGAGFRAVSPGRYEVHPERPEDFQRVLAEAFGSGKLECRGVVHLWSLETSAEPASLEALEADQELSTTSALHLVQALAQSGWRNMPRLWLVTAGARAVNESESPALAQAPLWGLGLVIAHEHPELRVRRVDLGREAHAQVDALLQELEAPDAEDQVALRAGTRYAARLVRDAEAAQVVPALDPEATYLVTGGLGGIGLEVTRWLAKQGARSLALMSRGAPSAGAQEVLDALRSDGVRVTLFQADVSRPEQVARAFEELDRSLPPLKGVIHMAAVLDDGILMQLDQRRMRQVMAPKLAGSWNLHVQTRGRPLDFFVLFSSVVSLFGAPGQGNYTAASAFLDALAHHRRALGLPAVSINWGPWAQVGLAATQSNRGQRVAGQGVTNLSPEQGLEALGRLMKSSAAQVGVVSVDLRQWREFFPTVADSPFLSLLPREERRGGSKKPSQLRAALAAEEPGRRQAMLTEHLREQVARVLRLEPARIDPSVPFGSLGLDSLMGLEVRNRLEANLGLRLPATLLWAYPTLAALAPHLLSKLELQAPAPAEPAPTEPAPEEDTLGQVASQIEQLSEKEMEALLLQKLQNM
jgi:myxalamid-type polyketide synthase MxaE and MxaD